jgi:exopolysaccharide biosynthesis protein
MKNLIQLSIVLFLLVQTVGYSQTKKPKTNSKQNSITKIDTKNLKKFIGKYFLEEANFELEIVQKKGKMYIITEFSKDELILTNETTLHESTRGVDLELIKDDKDALKFSQNGYETTIKRVKS